MICWCLTINQRGLCSLTGLKLAEMQQKHLYSGAEKYSGSNNCSLVRQSPVCKSLLTPRWCGNCMFPAWFGLVPVCIVNRLQGKITLQRDKIIAFGHPDFHGNSYRAYSCQQRKHHTIMHAQQGIEQILLQANVLINSSCGNEHNAVHSLFQ